MTTYLTLCFAALLGLVIGGAINWLADDLPHTYRVRPPHYPDGTPRPRLAWLGVSAYLTRLHLSPSGTRLSWRYPLTEIVTAALFAYVATRYPDPATVIVFWGNIAVLMLITVIDLEHRLILTLVILIGCAWALVGNAIAGPVIAPRIPFADYLIGAAAGFALFLVLYLGGMLFSNVVSSARGEALDEVAFGYGDVFLAMLAGCILGWQALIFAVFIAVFAGGIGSVLFLGVRLALGGRYEWFTALPYGQYIVFGTLVMMLWRSNIASFFR
jgi:prepilin signal peptidase PulO-like enzyme (type II secretory pathway)